MSHNTLAGFERANEGHTLLAMLAISAISDGTLSLQSAQGAEAIYATAERDLRVHARLNESSRYDVTSIDAPNVAPIYLPAACRATAYSYAYADILGFDSYGRGALKRTLTRALMTLNDTKAPEGPPGPSNARVESHYGSPSGPIPVLGSSRSQPAHSRRSAPYQAQPLPSVVGASSADKPPKRRDPSDAEIDAHLHDGESFRTQKEIIKALRDNRLVASKGRIKARLEAAGGHGSTQTPRIRSSSSTCAGPTGR